MTSFKIHVEDALERLKKGQTVHGRATPGTMPTSAGSRASPAPPQSGPKGILKRPSLPGLIEEGDETGTTPGGLEAEDSRLTTGRFGKWVDGWALDISVGCGIVNLAWDLFRF